MDKGAMEILLRLFFGLMYSAPDGDKITCYVDDSASIPQHQA